MKLIIIGGHLAPALSVLEVLPKNIKVLFVGRKYALEGDNALSLEYRTISALGIPFVGLNTGRLQRKVTKFTLLSLLKLPFGIIKSFLILLTFKPDVVVGFGGYVSIPVSFCAFLLGIPIIIHEQTMEAGLANRIISKFAKKVCISWNTSRKYFPKNKIVLTGNPIRKFITLNSKFSIFNNNLPTIYITGGSSGSHAINALTEEIIEQLLLFCNVIHQTGDAQKYHDFDRLIKIRNNLPETLRENYIIQKLIDPAGIGDILKSSDLIISRSGMNTVSELVYFEKPAILIPLPFSQHDEQLKNAKFLEKIGLGTVLQQRTLSGKRLLNSIRAKLNNISRFKLNRTEIGNVGGKNAAKNIISVIDYVYKTKTTKNT